MPRPARLYVQLRLVVEGTLYGVTYTEGAARSLTPPLSMYNADVTLSSEHANPELANGGRIRCQLQWAAPAIVSMQCLPPCMNY